MNVPVIHVSALIAAILLLVPYLDAAFFSAHVSGSARRLPLWGQIAAPALLCIPYLLVSTSAGAFSWAWLTVYAVVPVAMTATVCFAPDNAHGYLPRLLVLVLLGLSVDLRWFEPAWPAHLAIFNKVLLLDAGIYAFVALRPLRDTGFDLRLKFRDLATGMREFLFYLPIALPLGLWLGFLHRHAVQASVTHYLLQFAQAWVFTFFFIAVPEELFFRGWLQNLFERRMGKTGALLVAAILFGLSHFNKRAEFFNWRYVLLAAIAGIFYGRAWRRDRRVGASSVTHATVDAVWSLFLR